MNFIFFIVIIFHIFCFLYSVEVECECAQTQGKPPLKKRIFCEKFLDGIFTRCIVSGGVRRHKGCNKA